MDIRTNRLKLRLLRETDIGDAFEIYGDKNTCRYLLHEPWTTATKGEAFLKKLSAQKLTHDSAICLACELGAKVIGVITIWYTEIKETVEIGYAFNNAYLKNGYVTEAVNSVIDYLFNTMKVHRIQARLDARNISSAKLCERVGMRKEAHFIKDFWNKGEWTDSFIYGMLISDFENRKTNMML